MNVDNYKLVVITGGEKENVITNFFGNDEEYRFHIECLKDYMYTYYNDIAEKEDVDHLKTSEEIIFLLNELGNIVYLHSRGYGLAFIPKGICEEQINALHNLFTMILEMPIYIGYNLTKKSGKLEFEDMASYEKGLENIENLDGLLKTYVKKGKSNGKS